MFCLQTALSIYIYRIIYFGSAATACRLSEQVRAYCIGGVMNASNPEQTGISLYIISIFIRTLYFSPPL